MNLLLISGSLRKASLNTRLLREVEALVGERATCAWADIGSLQLFNDDLEADLPDSVRSFRAQVAAADGVIVCSPEYNHSVPGVLKNAIDWASRPPGKAAWKGKRVGLMGASPGAVGTARSKGHLIPVFVCVGCTLAPGPEISIGQAHERLAEGGGFADDSTAAFIAKWVDSFLGFVADGTPRPS